jgi:hypothetical protein
MIQLHRIDMEVIPYSYCFGVTAGRLNSAPTAVGRGLVGVPGVMILVLKEGTL